MSEFTKDPDDVLDYHIDWAAWLNGDTIATSSWLVPAGITKDSDSNTDETATIWLSGGTASTIYQVTNRIVTAAGRTKDQSIWIAIQEQ